jgi:hypothetical protein
MNYIRQSKAYDCSVIAIINAFKWTGIRFNVREHYKAICDAFKLDSCGVDNVRFYRFLKRNKKNLPFRVVKNIKNPTLTQIRKNVNDNRTAIIGINYRGFGHVGTVVKVTKKFIYLTNWGAPVQKIAIKTFKKWCKDWSIIYVIERK